MVSRTAIFAFLTLAAVALAVPSIPARDIQFEMPPFSTRFTVMCNNVCYPYMFVAKKLCESQSRCAVKRCTIKIGASRLNGWKCGPASVASASVSATPSPATPSSTPSPAPPALVSCSLNVGSNLDFHCTCKDTQDNEHTTTVDAAASFDGTDRSSKGCFETCLYENAMSSCSVPFSDTTFTDDITSNVNYCCSSCDGEVTGGVCKPFNG